MCRRTPRAEAIRLLSPIIRFLRYSCLRLAVSGEFARWIRQRVTYVPTLNSLLDPVVEVVSLFDLLDYEGRAT